MFTYLLLVSGVWYSKVDLSEHWRNMSDNESLFFIFPEKLDEEK